MNSRNSLSQRTLWWREEFLLFVRYVELVSSCFKKQWRRGYTLQRFSIFHELAHFLLERIIEKENLETSPVFHARSSLQFWTLQFSGTPVAPRVFPCKICAWTLCAQRPYLWVHSLVYTAILDLLTIHPWGLTIRIDFIQESSVRH